MDKIASPVIGIDATNLRGGGGLTHIVEILAAADPKSHGFERIVVWGGSSTLRCIEDRPWLEKRSPPQLDRGLISRACWQAFKLSAAARSENCSILFVPGGSYSGTFRPVVTMSQNLLPFEKEELKRFGLSKMLVKMLLLRQTQKNSYLKSDGIIFLTEYARSVVSGITGTLAGSSRVIPHGLNSRFFSSPTAQHDIATYDQSKPFKCLYVSIVDVYKHQWHVVDAVAKLRNLGMPVVLDLVGPAYKPALRKLNRKLDSVDPGRDWVRYHGAVEFTELHHHYANADVGIFASTCENMPIILLEMMASGLPIACSDKGPMPEILGDSAAYFNPENFETIATAILKLIDSPSRRTSLAAASWSRANAYSWRRCAHETFSFLKYIIQSNKGN